MLKKPKQKAALLQEFVGGNKEIPFWELGIKKFVNRDYLVQSSNGSGGIPQDELLGNTDVQKEVEKELSQAKGKEAALA